MATKLKYAGKYPPKHFNRDIVVKDLKKHKDHIRGKLKTHGAEVKKELKKVIETSVGNGRHYSGLPNRSSAAGQPPVDQHGKLANGFRYNSYPLQLKIGNIANNEGAPYPAFLEDGTKKMAPRPYFVDTIEAYHYKLYRDLHDWPKG